MPNAIPEDRMRGTIDIEIIAPSVHASSGPSGRPYNNNQAAEAAEPLFSFCLSRQFFITEFCALNTFHFYL